MQLENLYSLVKMLSILKFMNCNLLKFYYKMNAWYIFEPFPLKNMFYSKLQKWGCFSDIKAAENLKCYEKNCRKQEFCKEYYILHNVGKAEEKPTLVIYSSCFSCVFKIFDSNVIGFLQINMERFARHIFKYVFQCS